MLPKDTWGYLPIAPSAKDKGAWELWDEHQRHQKPKLARKQAKALVPILLLEDLQLGSADYRCTIIVQPVTAGEGGPVVRRLRPVEVQGPADESPGSDQADPEGLRLPAGPPRGGDQDRSAASGVAGGGDPVSRGTRAHRLGTALVATLWAEMASPHRCPTLGFKVTP